MPPATDLIMLLALTDLKEESREPLLEVSGHTWRNYISVADARTF